MNIENVAGVQTGRGIGMSISFLVAFGIIISCYAVLFFIPGMLAWEVRSQGIALGIVELRVIGALTLTTLGLLFIVFTVTMTNKFLLT